MTWFIFSVICILGWGTADLFYKKSADESDKHSYLKTAVWVGMVMGICAIALLSVSESAFSVNSFIISSVKYLPASLSYILSMIIGYAGLRYLEVSIVSPIQNASGGLSAICILVFFLVTGKITNISDEFSVIDIIGTILIVLGVVFLAIVEKKSEGAVPDNKKHKLGLLALLFPLLYCVFDTIGTAADGIILDEETGLGLGEIDVIIIYGITFMIAGIISWIVLLFKEKKVYNPFAKKEIPKCIAACCEEFGQIFYVFSMAKNPVLAAPMVASYCIISVILSRVFLKEKLSIHQYSCIFAVIAGIVLLGISEGLAELS